MSQNPGVELKVLTSGILKQPLRELVPRFENAHACTVKVSWGPSSGNSPESNVVRVRNGEACDLLLMVSTGLDKLIDEGRLRGTTRRDIATSEIGVAVRSDHLALDVSSVSALRRCLLDAESVGYSEGASGSYVGGRLFQALGIEAELACKSRVILGRKFVGEAVAQGEVEIGIQQISELRLVPGITILGPLPAEVQHVSLVCGVIPANARHPELAGELLEFLGSGAADDALARAGLCRPRR